MFSLLCVEVTLWCLVRIFANLRQVILGDGRFLNIDPCDMHARSGASSAIIAKIKWRPLEVWIASAGQAKS